MQGHGVQGFGLKSVHALCLMLLCSGMEGRMSRKRGANCAALGLPEGTCQVPGI